MGTAVVTGCATGIGAATRKRIEAQGFDVIGVDIKDAEVIADLSTAAGRSKAVEDVLERSDGRLDRGAFCAGLGGHVDDIAAVVSVNYFGVVELIDRLLPAFQVGEAPAVVVVASNSSAMSDFIADGPIVAACLAGDEAKAREEVLANDSGQMAYIASKNAVARAVRRRSESWGEAGVRINAICPGPTKTPLLEGGLGTPGAGDAIRGLPVPLGRWASADEMAGIIEFLLGSGAAFVHGSIWYADGGTDAMIRSDRF
jgi:NAD(P)-dependent dehydrogenase (short-subunit alcohol dehydrogenase family)